MMEVFAQGFAPPIKISDGIREREIEKREWIKSVPWLENGCVQSMGYMGQCQLEEVWKRYNKEIYISNYGYVARIEEEEAKKIFGDKFEDFGKWNGIIYKKLEAHQKNLIKDRNEVPENRKNSGCQICLWVKDGGDVHRMVSELFLEKPYGYEEGGWCVHHIDNNSYNNSVANLIWLRNETHQGGNHRMFHPMSHK